MGAFGITSSLPPLQSLEAVGVIPTTASSPLTPPLFVLSLLLLVSKQRCYTGIILAFGGSGTHGACCHSATKHGRASSKWGPAPAATLSTRMPGHEEGWKLEPVFHPQHQLRPRCCSIYCFLPVPEPESCVCCLVCLWQLHPGGIRGRKAAKSMSRTDNARSGQEPSLKILGYFRSSG